MTNAEKELIRRAFHVLDTAEASHYESLEQASHQFSEKFERKIQKLIRIERQPIYPLIKTPARKIASLLAVLLILFSLSLSVSAIRKQIIDWIVQIHDTFIEISYPQNSFGDGNFTEHQVTWIPEDFSLTERIETPYRVKHTWKNNKEKIVLEQSRGNSSYSLDVPTTSYETTIAGRTIRCYTSDDAQFFVWIDEEYFFLLCCPIEFPTEDVEQMIISIQPKT